MNKHRKKSNKTNKIYLKEWIKEIRRYLIVIEEKNINLRCKAFETIINEETINVSKQIFGKNEISENMRFRFMINNDNKMKEYLSYIYKWKGLTSSAKLPNTKKEYQNKARNWLNGRRTKQYGNDLYCDMIKQSFKVRIIIVFLLSDTLRPSRITPNQKQN